MQFPDRLTSKGEPECYSNGELTHRFEMVADIPLEVEAMRAALTNVALMALQSEVALSAEDSRMLVDFLRLDPNQQGRLIVWTAQADRLARLIERGSATATPSLIKNQFSYLENHKAKQLTEEELETEAAAVVAALHIEVNARRFRRQLHDLPEGQRDS